MRVAAAQHINANRLEPRMDPSRIVIRVAATLGQKIEVRKSLREG
jgi:hypothetical protein